MAKEKLECSFCGRKPDTSLLIAGIDAHICDKCIEQAHGIVFRRIRSSKLAGDLILKKPKEIRAFLDQYVIGQDQTKKSNVSCGLQSLQTFDASSKWTMK
jgi:ATP-dependent Clp protease ATP-binding subunit ClpX